MLHSRIFTFNPLGTNCVVLWEDGQKACTVVDPGMSSADGAQDLFDFFEKQGLTPDAILLTHGHFDHFWGVEKLLARYSVPVYLHPEDKEVMDNVTGTPGVTESFSFLRHDFPTVDVADGEVLTTAGTAWKVIHTPGHTPGGVCYYSAENNLLLSGDTLFAGSIGRTDLPRPLPRRGCTILSCSRSTSPEEIFRKRVYPLKEYDHPLAGQHRLHQFGGLAPAAGTARRYGTGGL